ncbi:MAG: formimidoylglutamate deiminase, partial [Novosphingobium sp.]
GMGLAEGQAADFITLDAGHPALCGATGDQWLDQWIFAGGRGTVDGVWRRGKQVVKGGRHLSRDAISRAYRSTLARLLA